jgi:hypothetical protein
MATKKKTKVKKAIRTKKSTKPPARCTIDFEPNGITSPAIEMEAFMWEGYVTEFLDKPRPEVCITIYEDSVSNVYIQSPADLEKMANWLLRTAEWMRNKKNGE